jgi:hypothetical protein
MRLQGAADARRRTRSRTAVLQASGNAADVVPCERIRKFLKTRFIRVGIAFYFAFAHSRCIWNYAMSGALKLLAVPVIERLQTISERTFHT